MRRWIVKLLIAAAIFFVILEIGGRLALGDAKVRRGCPIDAYFAALGSHPVDAPSQPKPIFKEKSGFRFVILGDSTAVGFPYSENLSFGAFLAAGLTAATGTKCEFVTIATPGRSSAGVAAELNLAFEAKPDCILLYIGHNEFAHRISNISPFGRWRRDSVKNVFAGIDNILKGIRDARRRPDIRNLPTRFPSELRAAAELLAAGDPFERSAYLLPLEQEEIEFHKERFKSNIQKIASAARDRNIPIFIIEPASSLLAPPLSSGDLYDSRAREAHAEGLELLKSDPEAARRALRRARDFDPAPVRMTTEMTEVLRRAASPSPTIHIEKEYTEENYCDLVHPKPPLAAIFAERIATELTGGVPHLENVNKHFVDAFREAAAARIAAPESKSIIISGDEGGRLLAAHMYLQNGNRAAAERIAGGIPIGERSFGIFLILDMALRLRGARDEANNIFNEMLRLHPDWKEPLDWWRARADR